MLKADSQLYRLDFSVNLAYASLLSLFTDNFRKITIKFSKLLLTVLLFSTSPSSLAFFSSPLTITPLLVYHNKYIIYFM
jgi:hypothetical protein